jgi:hypothetical protein
VKSNILKKNRKRRVLFFNFTKYYLGRIKRQALDETGLKHLTGFETN